MEISIEKLCFDKGIKEGEMLIESMLTKINNQHEHLSKFHKNEILIGSAISFMALSLHRLLSDNKSITLEATLGVVIKNLKTSLINLDTPTNSQG
jgi:hypothetical protein